MLYLVFFKLQLFANAFLGLVLLFLGRETFLHFLKPCDKTRRSTKFSLLLVNIDLFFYSLNGMKVTRTNTIDCYVLLFDLGLSASTEVTDFKYQLQFLLICNHRHLKHSQVHFQFYSLLFATAPETQYLYH